MKLRMGEKGDLIRDIQNSLLKHGYNPGPIDGIFRKNTKRAITKLQKDKHVKTDGMVGPLTLTLLGLNPELHDPRPQRKIRRGIFTPNKSKGCSSRR